MSSDEKCRPPRTTMEGMIWNANHVLDAALDPKSVGIPRDLFRLCRGVVLISVVEAGFIFSGNVGTGVVIAQRGPGIWSPPSALGLVGVGWGLIAGGEVKDIVIMIMDDATMNTFSGEAQIKFGGEASLTLGPVGREAEVSLNASNRGIGGSFSYTFSRGFFGGVAIEGAVLGVRGAENARFYGRGLSPKAILYEDGAAEAPAGSGVADLHRKLDMLTEGRTWEPAPADVQRKESMREEAERAGEEARASQSDVVKVNASEEAAKEAEAEKYGGSG